MAERDEFACLLPETRQVLKRLVGTASFLDKYTFVGGSALAMHLCHRLSEDLDFFTWGEGFDKGEIFSIVKAIPGTSIINETNEQVDLLIDGVKVTFFDAQWSFLRPERPERFNLATLDVLAGMKVHTLFLRAKYRDYYDLYILAKRMGLRRLYMLSEGVVDGINYRLFSAALLYIDDIEDDEIAHLAPKEQIGKEEIQKFFQERIRLR